MGLVEKHSLEAMLSPPLDALLTKQLLDEFVSIERRYILRDWEPAELDGGQFSEILARLVYCVDSGNIDRDRDFGDCQRYVMNDQVAHCIDRPDAKMLMMVVNVVHKFRSKRGAVHISSTYQANHMDSRYMVEAVRWAMAETVRVFSTRDRCIAAKAIAELLRFDVPAVGRFEDRILVQRTDLSAEEEIVILLHYAGDSGLTRSELGRFADRSAPAVTRAIDALTSARSRQVVKLASGQFVLTDLGQKRIRESLAEKLLLE